MRTCKLLIMISFILFSHVIFAEPVTPYLTYLPKGSDLSILVQSTDTKHKTIAQYNSHEFKFPASTLKIVTALAAVLELGDDFRFTTHFKTNGTISNKQLNGDLVIQLSGDPTFDRKRLNTMLLKLTELGINKINGNIILDTSIFTSHDKAPGWSWNNLTACYNVPPSATIIDSNCFIAEVTTTKVGDKAKIQVSSRYPVILSSNVMTIAKNSKKVSDKYCEFDITYLEKNRYHLSGCVIENTAHKPLKFAVLNSVDYFTSILKKELNKIKISYTGQILEQNLPLTNKLTLLASSQSLPLPNLLTVMLKNSNNLYADSLFRTIGAHYYKIPGTWKTGSDAIKQILLTKAGINLENSVIVDGSGLSRLNLISTDKIMEILHYIANNNSQLNMIAMLPVAGVDGTLRNRKSFNQNLFKNKIYAKTGFIQGTYNLAGFIKQPNNKYLAFVQFLSGYSSENNNEPQNNAIMQFEKEFYKNFIQ